MSSEIATVEPSVIPSPTPDWMAKYGDVASPTPTATPDWMAKYSDVSSTSDQLSPTPNPHWFAKYADIAVPEAPNAATALAETDAVAQNIESQQIVLPRMGTMGVESQLMGLDTNQEQPQWFKDAQAALGETAIQFVPKSPSEVIGMFNPVGQATSQGKEIVNTITDWVNGGDFNQALIKNDAQAAEIQAANDTAPLSKERFKVAFTLMAQTGMLFAGAKGLAKGGEPNAKPNIETAQSNGLRAGPEVPNETQQPTTNQSSQGLPASGQGTPLGTGAIASVEQPQNFLPRARAEPITPISQPATGGGEIVPAAASSQGGAAEAGLPAGTITVGGATPEEFMRRYALVGAFELLKGNTEMGAFQRGVESVFGSHIRDQIPAIMERAQAIVNEFPTATGKSAMANEINRQIGITRARDTPVLVRPFVAQKAALLAAEKAGTAGYKRGLREARAEGKAAAAQIKGDLMQADKFMAGDQEQVRQNMIEYAKAVLPKEERGAFINRITKALRRPALTRDPASMYRQAWDVMRQMEARGEQVYAKALRTEISDLSKSLLGSGGVSVAAKESWRETMKGSNLRDLSIEELEALRDQAQMLRQLGREEWKSRKQAIQDEENFRAADLANSDTKPTRDLEKMVRDTSVSTWQKIKDKIWNTNAGGLTWASTHEKSRLFIPRLFETLDGGQNGWLTRNVLHPFYTADRLYRAQYNPIRDKAIEIADRNNLGHENFINIGMHAHQMQEGTLKEALKYSTEPKELKAQYDAVEKNGLTKGEQELYDYFRQTYDKNLPDMLGFFADHYNKELKVYDNYFPRAIDPRKDATWRADRQQWTNPVSGEVVDPNNVADSLSHMIDYQYRTRSITKGFSKERLEGAEIPINFNAMDVFLRSQDNWAYVKNMQPHLNIVGKLANTNLFRAKYGKVGQAMVLDYVDALAKRGQYSRNMFERALDAVRNRSMTGLLGFRLNQFKHIAGYPLGMHEAGGGIWWERGVRLGRTVEGKDFIKQHWPEIQSASGGDISIREAAAQGKVSKGSFIVDRILDSQNRIGTAFGRYLEQLDAEGKSWQDWNTIPVDEQKINVSRQAYVNALGSAEFIDRPLILTKGTSIGSAPLGKAFMAYQSPKMVRWGMLRSALNEDLYRNKRFGSAIKKLGVTGVGSLMEASVKWGSRAAYVIAAGAILDMLGFKIYERKHENTAAHDLLTEALSDFTSIMPGGGLVQKAVAVHEYPGATDKILRETGVPPFDMTVNTMADATKYLFDPSDLKQASLLAQDTIQFAGIPISTLTSTYRAGQKLLDEKGQAKADSAQLRKEGQGGGTMSISKPVPLGGKHRHPRH